MNRCEDLDSLIHRLVMKETTDTPPLYSSEIQAAWQVVEKLAGDGDEHPACIQKGLPAFGDHATPFEVYKNYAGYPGWTCYFADYEVCAHADTAPLAICKAALKACGVEVESPK